MPVTVIAPELSTDTSHHGARMAELGDELGMLASRQSQWLTHRLVSVWDRRASHVEQDCQRDHSVHQYTRDGP